MSILCQRPSAPNLCVRNLFDFNTNQWRIRDLQQLFHPSSVQQIQNIELTPTFDISLPDRLVWKPNKNGSFSLKLAYQILTNQNRAESPQHIGAEIWKLKNLQSKIRAFLWKISHHALPCMYELSRRKLKVSPMCPRCGMENETIHHLIFICTVSRVTWFFSPLGIRSEELPLQPVQTLLWAFSNLQEEQLTLFGNIAWAIWKSRNNYIFRAQEENPTSIIAEAMALQAVRGHPLSNLRQAVQIDEVIKISPQQGAICLIDGSWDNNGQSGVGVAIYCSKGSLQHISSKPANSNGPFQAEVDALEHALQVIAELPILKPVLLLSDCKDLVEFLNTGDEEYIKDWRAYRQALQCRAFVQRNQHHFVVKYISRNLIDVPHKLTNFARKTQGYITGYPSTQLIVQLELGQKLPAVFFFSQ
ncbi:Ribonuclease H-like superfamily protein [Rhynchospora pubera]|uniref:Ribonuclease H-like superfamily protein n=1 Tax=Rhynchospora pubera TaxID=906938 RepID=A0AAV8CQM2_9POAL|nr:Ribonuclease H-like superfamily protein [Rhynchospora pubera]